MKLNEAIDILESNNYICEFLDYSYKNLNEIFKLIKKESKLLQKAIYADSKKIIIFDNDFKEKYLIELNNILEKKYNIYLSITDTSYDCIYNSNNTDNNISTFLKYMKINSNNYNEVTSRIKNKLKNNRSIDITTIHINTVSDKTKDIKSRRRSFYHISDIRPEVIARTGLKTNSAALRADMYNYNNALFLFSESEAEKLSKRKNYKGEKPLNILADDMCNGYIRGPEINYIYKVTIPDITKIFKDPDNNHFNTAVYINENIPPENIECVGFYIPYEWRIAKDDPRYNLVKADKYPVEHFGWYMGNMKKVEKLSTILKNNIPLKLKQLVPDTYFKKWHKDKYISKFD